MEYTGTEFYRYIKTNIKPKIANEASPGSMSDGFVQNTYIFSLNTILQ